MGINHSIALSLNPWSNGLLSIGPYKVCLHIQIGHVCVLIMSFLKLNLFGEKILCGNKARTAPYKCN
jgi:hypothetical protein